MLREFLIGLSGFVLGGWIGILSMALVAVGKEKDGEGSERTR